MNCEEIKYMDGQEKPDQRLQEWDEVMSCLCSAPFSHGSMGESAEMLDKNLTGE